MMSIDTSVCSMGVISLMAFSFVVASHGKLVANDPDNHSVPQAMVELIRKNEADAFARGKELFGSITDVRTKPLACQALALLAIQAGRYSAAWQAISSSPKLPESNSLQVGHDRILLWLLLEAQSGERVELHLEKLVTLMTSASADTTEIAETARFLGGVVALLESRGESSGVSIGVLNKSRTALESLKSEVAVQRFKSSYESARCWADSLESCRDEVQRLEPAQRLERAALVAQRLAEAKELHAREITDVRQLKQEKRKLEQVEKQYRGNWNPNLGMPQSPRRPVQDREERDNEFDKRVESYQRDVLEYPQRLADWEVVKKSRQKFFEGHLRIIHDKLAQTDSQLASVQESEKKSGELVQTLSKDSLLLQYVRKVLESSAEKDRNLFKPSFFNLLEFDLEAKRLESCLRQLK